jgi:hypothetical protein
MLSLHEQAVRRRKRRKSPSGEARSRLPKAVWNYERLLIASTQDVAFHTQVIADAKAGVYQGIPCTVQETLCEVLRESVICAMSPKGGNIPGHKAALRKVACLNGFSVSMLEAFTAYE